MSALGVLIAMVAMPLLLWRRLLTGTLHAFHVSVPYLFVDLGPWMLIACGIAFLVPVATSAGLHPESRYYPRGRHGYFIWGIVLYLLGCALALELSNLWRYSTSG